MKKFLLCFGLLIMVCSSHLRADERHNIELNNYGKNKEVIEIKGINDVDICRIEAVLKDVDDNGRYTIGITIENQDELHFIYLFARSYTKKQLRTKTLDRPSIVYAKGFNELSPRICKALNSATSTIVPIRPYDTVYMEIQVKDGEQSFECEIPLYFAKQIGWLWKRHSLIGVRNEFLHFIVDIKPPSDYDELSKTVDKLLASIAETKYVVCKHGGKKHNLELEQQKKATQMLIDTLAGMIQEEEMNNNVSYGSARYKKLKDLKEKLSNVDVNNIPVEECKRTEKGCSCSPKVAKMNLKDIVTRMEELYVDIYNGDKTKAEVIREAKTLKAHSGHIIRDPKNYKKNINKYYNNIIDY